MLKTHKIDSLPEFLKLENEWKDLLTQLNENTPFLSFDWIRLCVEYYGDGKRLNILTIRDESKLVGILPLWQVKDVIRHSPIVKLEIINCPDNPFTDFIISNKNSAEILSAGFQYFLSEDDGEWDLLHLQAIPENSANAEVLRDILHQHNIKYFPGYPSVIPYIAIETSWDDFLNTRSRKFRKTRRNINNRIKILDKVEIVCYTDGQQANLLEDILQVSRKGWKHTEGIAISSNEQAKGFFESFIPVAAKHNWLSVWFVKINEQPVAMEFDLEYDGKIYALRADFDGDFKEYSPGAYLEYCIIKYAFEKNFLEYNTGPGLRDYKLHWTDKMKKSMNLYICNKNLKGRYLWIFEGFFMPFMRRLKSIIVKDYKITI
jgi:CelD/BcsL family acetyltransferase involved in cellulose biosynthesis